MEEKFKKSLNNAVEEGAYAVLAVDTQGFVVGAKGSVPDKAPGVVATLAELAKQLSKESSTVESEVPFIELETESSVIHIQQKNLVTVAVYESLN